MDKDIRQEGTPKSAKTDVEVPLNKVNVENGKVSEVHTEKSAKTGTIIIFMLFCLAIIGLLFCIGYYLIGSGEKESSVSLNSENSPKVEAVNVKNTNVPLPSPDVNASQVVAPPLPEIDEFDIGGLTPSKTVTRGKIGNEDTDLLNTVLNRVNEVNEKLSKFEKIAIQNQELLLAIKNDSEKSKESTTNVFTALEEIAFALGSQSKHIEFISKNISEEKTTKLKLSRKPPFKVVSKSLWGDTVYLNISNDDGFDSQVSVGKSISGWTLKAINLQTKKTIWFNELGGEYELPLP